MESLHQNNRATLLFGKNNVLVQPVRTPTVLNLLSEISHGLLLLRNLLIKASFSHHDSLPLIRDGIIRIIPLKSRWFD